jgi:RND family efflux transporter MFP subunit
MSTEPKPTDLDDAHGEDAFAHGQDDLGFDLPAPAHLSRARAAVLASLAVAILGAAFVLAYMPRRRDRVALEAAARADDVGLLRVEVVSPKPSSSHRALTLPGSVQALQETIIYSRSDGYLRRWRADIGDSVGEGQLLAEIDTPELDQQLDQARAQLAQARAALGQAQANRDFSKSTFARYQPLTAKGITSEQDLDQRKAQASVDEANVQVAEANVAAQEANLRRLAQLKSFAQVTAPFAGTITVRSVEVGSLVTAGSTSPLFRLAAIDPARVFVQIPQDIAPNVRAGLAAKVTVREYPERAFDGTVTRASGELDPTSRTMNTEVRVANRDGALIPGMYAQVSLELPHPHRVLEIPATAVSNDAAGLRVAVVQPDGTLKLVPIVVERDTGATFEVAAGVAETDRVVKIAGTALLDGRPVVVVGTETQR